MSSTMKNATTTPMSQLTARTNEETCWLLPAVNVLELKDTFVIEAEMPGVDRAGLEITLEGHTLTLTGRRQTTPPPGEALYVESRPAGFRRVFELDPTINTSKTSARLEQGLLTVHLPKAEEVQPRRIQIAE